MSQYLCHDFKTPRSDSARRLPSAFALVPVLFYLSLIGGAYFNFTSYQSFSKATKDRDTWKQVTAQKTEAKATIERNMAGLMKEKARAEKLAQWIEGTRAMQPITVAVSRSLSPEITVGQLTMERSTELPAQITLTMTLNNGTVEDIARVHQGINALNYRPYNTQQSKNGEILEYHTMLIWQQM